MHRRLQFFWMRFRLGKDLYRAVISVLDWIDTVAEEDTRIFIDFPTYSSYFAFSFPRKQGSLPRKLGKKSEHEYSFIIRPPVSRVGESWMRIFSSPDVEVLEKKRERYFLTPLRHGLTNSEKEQALALARAHAERVLKKTKETGSYNLSQRFFLSADVNVAIWLNGELRGSQIAEGRSFRDGLEEAVSRALADARFKPVAPDEFQDVRIEIAIMSPLRVALSTRARKQNRIFPEKGYLLALGGRRGWFLPEVFNVRNFHTLDDMLANLAEEKAGVSAAAVGTSDIRIFETHDFIESEDHAKAISLAGSMPSPAPVGDTREKYKEVANWLCSMCEPDGSIRPIASPNMRRVTQIDWPRGAFSAWALFEFGTAVGEPRYRAIAEKSYAYFRSYLFDREKAVLHRELALAYLGRLAHALGKISDVHAISASLLSAIPQVAFEPILYAQIAGFLRSLGESVAVNGASELEQALKKNFEDLRASNASMSLASWAEIASLFERTDPSFSRAAYQWIVTQQLPSGAFPDTTGSDFVYTRGTGKIVEVLSRKPSEFKEPIEKALAWLFSMQYTHENMFFIPTNARSHMLGSFRHDYMNQDAWIDAAGHVLLAAARLAKADAGHE